MTLQLTRDPAYARGFFSPRSVTGFLSDVSPSAADAVGKIYLIADERVSFFFSMLIICFRAFVPLVISFSFRERKVHV